MIPTADGFVTLGSEGGHVDFAPRDEREFAILQYAWGEWPHVSAERLISGPGIELIYRALAKRNGVEAQSKTSEDIMHAALHAFNASNVGAAELYNSRGVHSTNIGGPTPFSTPTIFKGQVYMGTKTEVDVFGLCSTNGHSGCLQ